MQIALTTITCIKKLAVKHAISLCFIALSCLYYSTSRPVVGVNDGSQYALTAALTFEQRFSINSFIDYTKKIDYAFRAGNYYSDRTLAPSLLALPIIKLRQILNPGKNLSGEDSKLAQEAALIPNALMGAGTVILLFLLCQMLGSKKTASVMLASSYALGSLNWKYSSLFMGHAPAAFFLMLSIYIILKPDIFSKRRYLFMLAVSLSMLILSRYETVFLVLILIVYLLWRFYKNRQSIKILTLLTAISIFSSPLLFLAFYHTASFGGPLQTYTNYYNPSRTYFRNDKAQPKKIVNGYDIGHMYSRSITKGLHITFTSWPKVEGSKFRNRGLLILQPILLLSIFGWISFYRRREIRAYFCLAFSLASISVLSNSLTLGIDGGGMLDPRYSFTVLPLLFLPLVFFIDYKTKEVLPLTRWCLFVALSTLGVIICAVHFIESDNFYGRGSILWLQNSAISLIDQRLIRNIFDRLFVSAHLIHLILLPLLLLTALIHIGRQALSARPLSRLSLDYLHKFILTVSILLNLLLFSLNIYCVLNPDNKFNTFEDTIQVSKQKAQMAVQQAGFVRTLSDNKKSSDSIRKDLDISHCDTIFTSAPASDIRIMTPINKHTLIGELLYLSPSNHFQDQHLDIEVVIEQEGAKLWQKNLRNIRHSSQKIDISLKEGAPVLLRLIRNHNATYGALIGWCNIEFN